MPAKKKQSKWGRRFKKVSKYADKASQALALASKVAKLVNAEVKHFDTSTSITWLTPDNATGEIGSLFNIPQGTSVNTRNGDSIKATHLNVKVLMATGNGAQFLKCLIVRGKNERGVAPALNTLYTTTGSQAIMHSTRNVDWDTTYKILYTKTMFFPSNSGDYESRRIWNINLRLNSHIVFNKGSSSPATAETGGIYIVFFSDASNGNNEPNVQYTARLHYLDN